MFDPEERSLSSHPPESWIRIERLQGEGHLIDSINISHTFSWKKRLSKDTNIRLKTYIILLFVPHQWRGVCSTFWPFCSLFLFLIPRPITPSYTQRLWHPVTMGSVSVLVFHLIFLFLWFSPQNPQNMFSSTEAAFFKTAPHTPVFLPLCVPLPINFGAEHTPIYSSLIITYLPPADLLQSNTALSSH